MPEIKRQFGASKMNKDIDERLVPSGEYRDAQNVEINTSEGSNVGTVQTVKGNTKLDDIFSSNDFDCVGSIADHKNDKIYWMVAGPETGEASNITTETGSFTGGAQVYKDYILEYNIQTTQYRYIVVDIHKVVTKEVSGSHASNKSHVHIPDMGTSTINITGVRIGMKLTGLFTNNSGGTITAPDGTSVANGQTYSISEIDNVFVTNIVKDAGSPSDWAISLSKDIEISQDDDIIFSAPRVLNYHKDRLITGINIMDGMLFWTDNHTEPKKINIERCALGTGGTEYLKGGGTAGFAAGSPTSDLFFQLDATHGFPTSDRTDHFHTRLVSSIDGFNLEVVTNFAGNKAVFLEEEHITVLRKAPLTPPHLDMSITEAERNNSTTGIANNTSTIIDFAFSDVNPVSGNSELLSAGDGPFEIFFNEPVDFRPGDVLIFTSDENADEDTFIEHEVRIRIEDVPSGHSAPDTILSGAAGDAFTYIVLGIDPFLPTGTTTFRCRLQQSRPLFENKFVRFAYRYKYKDGEYSVISPYSEIAFKPGEFDYAPVQAYNLGMTNQLRNLKITDYVVEDSTRGRDVVEVDILYKEEGKPQIYTVESIKISDESPRWPGGVYERGVYELTSELIHALLPEDQLIRPFDNVPRKALAQEIVANRLVYANYLQNFNISKNGVEILPQLKLSATHSLSDLARVFAETATFDPLPSADPFKSVKTLRTYQLGVVYRDEYGRETPVLTGGKDSTLKLEKEEAFKINKLTAKITTEAPDFAHSWKFFVKETSNEYYNLAMDRWYNAEDGNIWISFASAERNKVDEDTFLILKKQHENDVPVTDLARYKVIAISNEAPLFITLDQRLIGTANPSNFSLISQIVRTDNVNSFPFEDYREFDVRGTEFFRSMSASSGAPSTLDPNILQALYAGQVHIRFTVAGVTSKYYRVTSIKPSYDQPGTFSSITIDGTFGKDVNFLAPDQDLASIVSSISIQMVTRIPEKKPEFDGRFFVKIYKDLVLQENILSQTNEENFQVVYALNSNYLSYTSLFENSDQNTIPDDPISSPPDHATIGGNIFLLKSTTADSVFNTASESDATWHFRPAGFSDAQIRALEQGVRGSQRGKRRRQHRAWWTAWARSGSTWFIDSAITANETTSPDGSDNNINFKGNTNTSASTSYFNEQSNIKNGQHGIFDASKASFNPTGTTGKGTALLLSYAGISDSEATRLTLDPDAKTTNQSFHPNDFGDVNNQPEEAESVSFLQPEKQFRFRDDPDQIVYTIKSTRVLPRRFNFDPVNDAGGFDDFQNDQNRRYSIELIIEDKNGFGIGNANGNGNSYHPYDHANASGADWGTAMDHNSKGVIEFVEPFDPFDGKLSSTNPAIWETEPKEDVGLDIYYEVSQAYPFVLDADTNEQYGKIGAVVNKESGNAFGVTTKVQSWSSQTVTLDTAIDKDVIANDIITFTTSDGAVNRLIAKQASASGSTTITFYGTLRDQETDPDKMPHKQTFDLAYSNCYSFGNGVESNRIRDDFNQPYIKNGVKASTVLAKHYEEERKATGLIHSGIYNSVSGINETNQFLAGKKITKDLNPRHGSIQVVKSRDTNLAVVTEDKCFSIIADKDALFKADGNADLLSKNVVLGAVTTYQGDYGTKNPESFTIDNYRSYFVDAARGQVCRLSNDGVTPISSQGMHDWFADNLKPGTVDGTQTTIKKIIGTFDDRKSLYNVSITQQFEVPKNDNNAKAYAAPTTTVYTLSYSENSKGWVSFRDIDPENGLSINNDFYTFKFGALWKEYSNDTRNNFYGVQYESSLTAIFNDQPGSIKSFTSVNYEGTQAKITKELTDNNYYNLKDFTGWYLDNFVTNEQTASIPNFIEKEGKWYNYLKGETTSHVNDEIDLSVTSSNLDQKEFSVQGLGVPSSVSGSGDTRRYKFVVKNNESTTYNPDTEIDSNTDGAADGVWDSTAD